MAQSHPTVLKALQSLAQLDGARKSRKVKVDPVQREKENEAERQLQGILLQYMDEEKRTQKYVPELQRYMVVKGGKPKLHTLDEYFAANTFYSFMQKVFQDDLQNLAGGAQTAGTRAKQELVNSYLQNMKGMAQKYHIFLGRSRLDHGEAGKRKVVLTDKPPKSRDIMGLQPLN